MVNLAYFAFVLRVTAVTAAMGQSAAATTYTYQAIAVPPGLRDMGRELIR